MEPGSDIHSPRLDDEIPSGSLAHEEVRERSELARHLRGSIFPAERPAIVQCALEEDAPDEMIEELRRLPDEEVFVNVEAVWEALGGHRERRTRDDPHADEPRTTLTPPARTPKSPASSRLNPTQPRCPNLSGHPPAWVGCRRQQPSDLAKCCRQTELDLVTASGSKSSVSAIRRWHPPGGHHGALWTTMMGLWI